MRIQASLLLSTLAVVIAGCGKSDGTDLKPVTGKVTFKGAALANATVTFRPIEGTQGAGGHGKTDNSGNFKITYAKGGDGLPAGKYKITVSHRLNPDGTVPPDDEPPIESRAVEKLPPKYSDMEKTELTETVKGEPIALNLK